MVKAFGSRPAKGLNPGRVRGLNPIMKKATEGATAIET
jgi:hypothetical protein